MTQPQEIIRASRYRHAFAAATFFGLLVASAPAAVAADSKAPHTADWSHERFQLGMWSCTARGGGLQGVYQAVYTLEYGGAVLRARIITTDPKGRRSIADFNTVRPDERTYAGVWVTDDGAIGTWTNAGWTGNQFTEIGYTLKQGQLTDRTEFRFTKISDVEYTYENVRNGQILEEDRCKKVADLHTAPG